jgi:hypothetical protein
MKSAAIFCRQVVTWVLYMLCKIYLVKDHKISNNSTADKARKRIAQILNPWKLEIF